MKIDKEKLKEKANSLASSAKKIAVEAAIKSKDTAIVVGTKTKEAAIKSKDAAIKSKEKVVEIMDVNGDGQVDIEDIIILGLRTPGIKIDREEFLRRELFKNYSEDIIEKAIKENPSKAGIKIEELDKIADEIIKYERNCVSGISAALGTPGGATMALTLPADIIQYYGYMLRAAQKLMYLYGFPEINLEEKNEVLDSETLNILIICLGVMYGVAGANSAIKAMASGLAKGISRKIMSTALTKGTIYPIVKNIAKWFGVKMTKKLLVSAVQKSLPLIGGIAGGGITYISFKPCCDKLKISLQNTHLTNPEYVATEEEKIIIDCLEI